MARRPKACTGRPPQRREPTIREVAAHAGVSLATVSRVLNSSALVSEEKKKRVLAAVAALGYTPHEAARSLVRRRTNTVAFILPEVSGDFYSQLLRGAELAAREFGFHLLVSGFHGKALEVKKALRATRGRVDGIVLMWPEVHRDSLLSAIPEGTKVVLLEGPEDPHHPSLALDNKAGTEAAVRHLVSLGHRVIGHLQGPVTNLDAEARRHAFLSVIRQTPGAVAVEIPGDFTEGRGYEAAPLFLAQKPRPTAVFAANDASAVGLLLRLAELGVAVPEEISLVGFDDIPLARLVNPPLTTVAAGTEELGRKAVELVAANPPKRLPQRVLLPTRLVVRRSTAPPKEQL
ncbi:MAG: LacI family DNA-binding transcriptional regulator [Thermoanaerobaculum sp.]